MSKSRKPNHGKSFAPTIPGKVRCAYCDREMQDIKGTMQKHLETCKGLKLSENNKSKNVVRKYHANKLF